MTVGANNDRLWQRLCTAMDAGHLPVDPRFSTNANRMSHRAELVQALEERTRTRTTAEWVDVLLGAGVPAGPIQDYRQVLEEDPHVKARGMVTEIEHPVEGTVRMLASPLRFSATPTTVRRPPPLLGEHNAEVLGPVLAGRAGDGTSPDGAAADGVSRDGVPGGAGPAGAAADGVSRDGAVPDGARPDGAGTDGAVRNRTAVEQ